MQQPDSSNAPLPNVDAELLLQGVVCPLNFVRTKIALAKLPIGAVLSVTVDRGEPELNVPRSLIREGQEVLFQGASANGWQVIVRRAK